MQYSQLLHLQKNDTLYAYFEYHGTNYAADMARRGEDKTTQKSWRSWSRCRDPTHRKQGEWWSPIGKNSISKSVTRAGAFPRAFSATHALCENREEYFGSNAGKRFGPRVLFLEPTNSWGARKKLPPSGRHRGPHREKSTVIGSRPGDTRITARCSRHKDVSISFCRRRVCS